MDLCRDILESVNISPSGLHTGQTLPIDTFTQGSKYLRNIIKITATCVVCVPTRRVKFNYQFRPQS